MKIKYVLALLIALIMPLVAHAVQFPHLNDQIMRTDIIPHVKEGDYAAAAMAASQSVVGTLTGQVVPMGAVEDTSAYRNGGIFDEAGLLSETQKESIQNMIEAEKRIPIIVAIVSSLRGQGTSYFSQVQTDLQLGRKTKNEMVFIAIAPNEKKIGLIIGDKTSDKYISDDRMGEINSTILIPYAKKRDYAGGIEQTILAIKTNLDNPRPLPEKSIISKLLEVKSSDGEFLTQIKERTKGYMLLFMAPLFFMVAAFHIYYEGESFLHALPFFLLWIFVTFIYFECLYIPIIWNIFVLILKLFGIKTLFGKKINFMKIRVRISSKSRGGFRGGGGRSSGSFSGGGGRSGGGGSSGRW